MSEPPRSSDPSEPIDPLAPSPGYQPGADYPAGGGDPGYPPGAAYPAYPPPGAAPLPEPGRRPAPGYPTDPAYAYSRVSSGPPGGPPPGPPGPPPVPAAAGGSGGWGAARLAARISGRPEPRYGVSLAALGVALIVFGLVVWAGNYVGTGGDNRRFLGGGLALLLVVAGYLLALRRPDSPFGNAGVAASGLGVPVMVGFLSYSHSDGGLPISMNAVALASMAVWLVSYLAVPAVRGHVFYLGAFAVTLWVFVLDKIEPHLFSWLPFALFGFTSVGVSAYGTPGNVVIGPDGSITGGSNDGVFAEFPHAPDFGTVAAVCLVFGVLYYLIAYGLDRGGRGGAAVAFVVAGFAATVAGLVVAGTQLPQAAAGVLVLVLSAAVALYGATRGRRFTAWVGTAGVGVGIVIVLAKVTPNNDTAAGLSMIVIGLVLVGLAPVVARLLREPDETRPRATGRIVGGPATGAPAP